MQVRLVLLRSGSKAFAVQLLHGWQGVIEEQLHLSEHSLVCVVAGCSLGAAEPLLQSGGVFERLGDLSDCFIQGVGVAL